MSLDKLAVIFIIIILPISVILSSYTTAQVDALKVQSLYDTKLYNATYDAVKAFQLNTYNEDISELSNSRLRLVKASTNAFLNSLGTNFNMHGYTKESLENYVPALVFTLYDGYYIYSKYINNIVLDYENKDGVPVVYPESTATYKPNETTTGIKPYIYYSCRYTSGANNDFIITYTLDNYITIQGLVNGKPVNDSGYLIDPEHVKVSANHSVEYNGFLIQPEKLTEYTGNDDSNPVVYHKVNGAKYYYDAKKDNAVTGTKGMWYVQRNGRRIYTPNQNFNPDEDYSAYYYYTEAKAFTERLEGYIGSLNLTVAGNCEDAKNDLEKFPDSNLGKIFNFTDIENPNSSFNVHRRAVIRYTIEKYLSIAIANYNNFFNGEADSNNFQMPKLKEDEWDKIFDNISVISFMQGLPIGYKIYNGCVVLPNNKNSEVVSENSIYIAEGDNNRTNPGNYYSPLSTELNSSGNYSGVFNIDLERRYFFDEKASDSVAGNYYHPKFYLADYGSVVTSDKISSENVDSVYEYFTKTAEGKNKTNVASAYFTALGRERFTTYDVHKNDTVELSR